MSITASVEQLAALQARPECIRNICVLAHVDHGKTTLSDNLIACNGLIHPKMVGKLRYMDYREDEQERGITMKSSSISLLFRPKQPAAYDAKCPEYLVNLIDSPGHVDFCSEVSTAARLSDGGLVLVDVAEGVHIQTHAVLRQAWEERVRPCLVLNKIDRLIMELRLTPLEAYERMKAIIAEVNNIINGFRSEKWISDVDAVLAGPNTDGVNGPEDGGEEQDELLDEDEEDAFAPEKGNVAFASAMDGWAFRIEQFAELYASKLGASEKALRRALWGDRYYHPKTKKIVGRKAAAGRLKPMFAQFCLEPVWQAYTAVLDSEEQERGEKVAKIVRAMNLAVPARDLQHKDTRVALQAVMSRWLPLSEAVLGMVVSCLPGPREAQADRLPRLLPKRLVRASAPTQLVEEIARIDTAVENCDGVPGAPCMVFVSKMIAVPFEQLPRRPPGREYHLDQADVRGSEDTDAGPSGKGECFVAFARVFSGRLREGQRVFVLSGGYDPTDPEGSKRHIQEAVVEGLFLIMGRGLEAVDSIPAGNVCGILGLGQHILKAATLTNTRAAWPMASMMFQAAPIVRVAVEPADPADIPALVRGLRLLNRADPFVEVLVSGSGEHVIGAAGEVHLERCIRDLQERFAKIKLEVSPPLVAFRETISEPEPASDRAVTKWGARKRLAASPLVEDSTPDGRCTVRVRVVRLPGGITTVLDEHAELLRGILTEEGGSSAGRRRGGAEAAGKEEEDPVSVLRDRLIQAAEEADAESEGSDVRGEGTDARPVGSDTKLGGTGAKPGGLEARTLTWRKLLEGMWGLGPRGVGPNVLLVPEVWRPDVGKLPGGVREEGKEGGAARSARSPSPAVSAGLERGVLVTEEPTVSGRLGLLQKRKTPPTAGSVDVGESSGASKGPDSAVPSALETGALSNDESNALSPDQDVSGQDFEDGVRSGVTSADRDLSAQELAESAVSSVVNGFQLATAAGPLCEEPLWGLGFIVEAVVKAESGEAENEDRATTGHGPFSGQVITAVREACRKAVLAANPRLAEAMYLCEVSTTAEALGQVYAVLGKRRARVLKEEMREGTAMFTVHAHMPVADSFGFADELRRKTSGAASPQLVLSHWEALPEDPFFVPRTEEELEEFGDGIGLAQNIARRMMDKVRRRKGLPVEEKIVEHATKQRTRAKKV